MKTALLLLPTLLVVFAPTSSAVVTVGAVYESATADCQMTFAGRFIEWSFSQDAELWEFAIKGTGTCATNGADQCLAVGSLSDGFTGYACILRSDDPCWDHFGSNLPFVVWRQIPYEFWQTCNQDALDMPLSFGIGPATEVGPGPRYSVAMTLQGVTQTGEVFFIL